MADSWCRLYQSRCSVRDELRKYGKRRTEMVWKGRRSLFASAEARPGATPTWVTMIIMPSKPGCATSFTG